MTTQPTNHIIDQLAHGNWKDDLEALTARYSELGIEPDIAGLSLPDALGVHSFLKRYDLVCKEGRAQQ